MTAFYPMYSYSNYALPNGTEPLIFLDFKNGIYQSEGVNVAVSSLVVENTDFGNYSVSNIQADIGLVEADPTFFGDALDLLLGGSTVVCSFTLPVPTAAGITFEMVDSASYNLDYHATFLNDVHCRLTDEVNSPTDVDPLAAGTHKTALTMIDGKMAASIDGGTLYALNPAVAWIPAPQIVIFGCGGNAVIESIGLYPVQSDADLPTLSAL